MYYFIVILWLKTQYITPKIFLTLNMTVMQLKKGHIMFLKHKKYMFIIFHLGMNYL